MWSRLEAILPSGMQQIASEEAKTQLPTLLDRVEHGEGFVITRKGRPAAHLLPVRSGTTDAKTAVANLRHFGQLHRGRLPTNDVGALIRDGRRF